MSKEQQKQALMTYNKETIVNLYLSIYEKAEAYDKLRAIIKDMF